MKVLNLYLDDRNPGAGCGWRDFIVLKRGRKQVALLAIGSMATARISDVPRSRVNKRIRANAAAFASSDARLREAIHATR